MKRDSWVGVYPLSRAHATIMAFSACVEMCFLTLVRSYVFMQRDHHRLRMCSLIGENGLNVASHVAEELRPGEGNARLLKMDKQWTV